MYTYLRGFPTYKKNALMNWLIQQNTVKRHEQSLTYQKYFTRPTSKIKYFFSDQFMQN